MPHIVFEATRELSQRLNFDAVLSGIHRQLAELGYARMEDLKSRVYVSDTSLAGEDPRAQYVVARLTTTNPRPPEVQREMGQVIHEHVVRAIEERKPDFWWQCCVLIEAIDRSNYVKADSRFPRA
jgi:5-carboxymethyl-2-hydroxymuconate isomerase